MTHRSFQDIDIMIAKNRCILFIIERKEPAVCHCCILKYFIVLFMYSLLYYLKYTCWELPVIYEL